MKIVVGLGNIGAHFDGARHNVGFAALEFFASANNLEWQVKDRFKATVAEGNLSGEKVILVKPNTYYNLSGDAVLAIKNFYKISNSDTLIIHDELALPFGVIRTRVGGSDAGNNGIKSVISTIGQDFARIRIGISNEFTEKTDAADFVLGHFTHDELKKIPDIATTTNKLIQDFIANNLEQTSISS
jgi:PTH1 family peptidyl-tRNA hydrolase